MSFPDAEAFARYRDDPETRSLTGPREAIIARTMIYVGREIDPYR